MQGDTSEAIGFLPHQCSIVEGGLCAQFANAAARDGAKETREAWDVGQGIDDAELAVGQ